MPKIGEFIYTNQQEICRKYTVWKRGKMNTKEAKEREWEIHKQLEEIRQQQEECDDLQRELEYLEEDSHWQNKQIKDVNDDLLDNYPKDSRLQNLLIEKEELLGQKIAFEKNFFEECRDFIREHQRKTESMKETCEAELLSIHEKEENEEE